MGVVNLRSDSMQRWLTAIEVAGFGAIAVAASGFAYLAAGPGAAACTGLLAVGGEAIYLAREFAYTVKVEPEPEVKANA